MRLESRYIRVLRFSSFQKGALVALFVGMLFGLSGCGRLIPGFTEHAARGKTFQPTVTVEVADSYKYASIQVDIIGISSDDYELWIQKSVHDYLSPGDKDRRAAIKRTLTFQGKKEPSKQISSEDPMWRLWKRKKVAFLVIIADLPGNHVDHAGNLDKRRLVLPLYTFKWDSSSLDDLTIHISPKGIESTPTPSAGNLPLAY